MSHRQSIKEDIPRHQTNKHKRPFVCRYAETTQLLPFMQEMLDSAVLKMKLNNKQQNHILIAQSIHLINKTLINMYKLNNDEIQVLIRQFLKELSYQFMQQQKKSTTVPATKPLLPFMKQMLDSIVLKMIPNNKRYNHLLISQSIHLINKTLINKLTRNEIQSLIRKFLQELSIRYVKEKNESATQNIHVKTELLPFMYELLDNVILKMTSTNTQNNQRLISESIFVINKRLVNKLNRDEIQSLIRCFLQELSTRFIQKTNECIDKPEHQCKHEHEEIDTKEDEDEDICLPVQEVSNTGFFNNLTITLPKELCKFLL